MEMRYVGLVAAAACLWVSSSWADGCRRTRESRGYRSSERYESRYASYRSGPESAYRSHCVPMRYDGAPRRVWQPGCWVRQDVGCGRYRPMWQPGHYVVLSSPGIMYVQSW